MFICLPLTLSDHSFAATANRFAFVGLFLFVAGCATTPKLKISTVEPANVVIVSTNTPDQVEDRLGESPQEVELTKVKGKMLKVTQPGRLPQYVLPIEADAPTVNVMLKLRTLSEIPEIHEEKGAAVDPNVTHRLLMQAYDAMAQEENLDQAISLADEILKLNKTIAAPYVIKGLVYLQQGKGELAKQEFRAAKSLDPGDSRIDALIRAADEGL